MSRAAIEVLDEVNLGLDDVLLSDALYRPENFNALEHMCTLLNLGLRESEPELVLGRMSLSDVIHRMARENHPSLTNASSAFRSKFKAFFVLFEYSSIRAGLEGLNFDDQVMSGFNNRIKHLIAPDDYPSQVHITTVSQEIMQLSMISFDRDFNRWVEAEQRLAICCAVLIINNSDRLPIGDYMVISNCSHSE